MNGTMLARASEFTTATTADPGTAAALNTLVQLVKSIYDARLTALSGGSIVVWEHLATFDQEVDLVWKARWSLGKILFLFNRYYTLFAVGFDLGIMFSPELTDTTCFRWFMWQGGTGLVSVFVSQLTLLLRLYPLYYLNKVVFWATAAAFIGSLVAAATILITNLIHVQATSQVILGLQFCIPNGLSSHFWTYWIPILSFESLIYALALFRAFSSALADSPTGNKDQPSDGHSSHCGLAAMIPRRLAQIFTNGQRIMDVLIRDSILYFLAIFAVYIVNCLIWKYGDVNIFETPIPFAEALPCVLSSRMLLNIRGVHRAMESEERSLPMQNLSPAARGGTTGLSTRSAPLNIHIQTIVETITVRDGDTDDELDSKTSTPIAPMPVLARGVTFDMEAQEDAHRESVQLRQLNNGDRTKLRKMRSR